MPYVTHSGKTWHSLGTGPGGNHIWPVEELLARHKFKPTVAERIARLNPNGKEEGEMWRGYYFHSHRLRACAEDVRPLRDYVVRWGTKDGAVICLKFGRHKYVTGRSFSNGPAAR